MLLLYYFNTIFCVTLSIVPHATVVGIPVGIAAASLTLIFTVTTGVVKKLFNVTRKKKKKNNKIIALARSKLEVNLADMQLLSRYNEGIRFLLCVIDIFSKYAWVVPLKDKKGISIVKAFQIILQKSNRKPNKIWVDKGSEFYNASFKKWLQDNDIVK